MDNYRLHRQKKISKRLEEKTAEEVGGKTTAASGAARFSGGSDVRVKGTIRIEHKYTENNWYNLKLSDLEKLQKQALKAGLEEPVLVVEFVKWREKYAIIPAVKKQVVNILSTNHRSIKLNLSDFRIKLQIQFLLENKSMLFKLQTWEGFLHDRDTYNRRLPGS